MGNGTSKEEQLYQAVVNSNHNAVKALRRDGASLEFVDKEGRTPLILACTRGDLFEMVLTLLNLGANIKAYRPGSYGGYPLHHAAKRGLDKTVLLLLSRGADPLAVNDDSLTPLEMARNRGHVAVVRMIEDRISTFSGMLRELSGPEVFQAIAPKFLTTKKIWAVILPTETDPRRTTRFDLVIYQAPKVAVPRTVISLSKAEVEEPILSLADPVVVILDRNTKAKYKFLSELEGDKAQLERFYNACKGIPQIAPVSSENPLAPQDAVQGLSALTRNDQEPPGGNSPANSHGPVLPNPKSRVELSEEAALKMAIEASLRTASAEGVPVGLLTSPDDLIDGRWVGETGHSQHSVWSSANEAGPSRVSELSEDPQDLHLSKVPEVLSEDPASTSSLVPPSAPPLPIHYPSIDTSPVNLEYPAVTPPEEASASAPKAEEKGSQCVVCWDAPAEGVCIPCGHLAGCMECLSEIKGKNWGCPVCRASIEQVIRVYAV